MSFCDEISDVIVVSSQYNSYDQPTYATLTPMKPSHFIFTDISSTSSIDSQTCQQLTPINVNMNYTNDEMEEDEPENDSNERNPGQNGEPCLVCGGVAKGLHFQVNSCRACAAFFRRSTKSKLVYRCQRGTGRCDLTVKVKGKPLCRYCRMKKCTSVGMRIESENI
uniref:Nuclear receptor domain-containing protein n=1 Tax=Panagrolaimus sp. JU765 TaxID=591449 RepID=A0AC34R293_9BILA